MRASSVAHSARSFHLECSENRHVASRGEVQTHCTRRKPLGGALQILTRKSSRLTSCGVAVEGSKMEKTVAKALRIIGIDHEVDRRTSVAAIAATAVTATAFAAYYYPEAFFGIRRGTLSSWAARGSGSTRHAKEKSVGPFACTWTVASTSRTSATPTPYVWPRRAATSSSSASSPTTRFVGARVPRC